MRKWWKPQPWKRLMLETSQPAPDKNADDTNELGSVNKEEDMNEC